MIKKIYKLPDCLFSWNIALLICFSVPFLIRLFCFCVFLLFLEKSVYAQVLPTFEQHIFSNEAWKKEHNKETELHPKTTLALALLLALILLSLCFCYSYRYRCCGCCYLNKNNFLRERTLRSKYLMSSSSSRVVVVVVGVSGHRLCPLRDAIRSIRLDFLIDRYTSPTIQPVSQPASQPADQSNHFDASD